MASYSKDIKIVFFLSLVNMGSGVGIQSCLAWFLLPEGRGQYATCMVVFATLLTLIFAVGQEMANVYYISAKQMTLSEAVTQSILVGILASSLACLIGYSLTLTSLPFLNKAPLHLFRFSLLCVPPMILHLYLSRIFLGIGEILIFKSVIIGVQFLALAGLIIAGTMHALDVKMAILIQSVSNAVMVLLDLSLLVFRYNCRLMVLRLGMLLKSLSYGLRYYFGKLATLANVQMATIVLSFAGGVRSEELGYFSAAIALSSQVLLIPEAVQIAALPRSAADSSGGSRLIAQSVRVCLLFSVAGVLILFVLGKPIIRILLSSQFLPTLIPLWVLLPGVLFRTASKILPAYFSGTNRPQVTSIIMGVTVVVQMVLVSVFLAPWGLVGVALASTITYTMEALSMVWAFKHFSGLSWRDIIGFNRTDYYTLVRVMKNTLPRYSWLKLESFKSLEQP